MRKQLLRRHARVCLLVATAVLASPAAVIAESADTIAVNVDQAKLVRLPGKVATIVVGNPLIADVTLQPGGMIVVT
jgi:Flp pilus assembly secretin CpaC